MVDDYNKDALLNEISRRVIQLDSQRQFDADLDTTVRAYIEALDEITGLTKPDIEAIAQQVIHEYSLSPRPLKSGRLTSKNWLLVGGAGLAALLLLAIFAGKYLGLKEGIQGGGAGQDSQINNRALIIRAKLAEVFALSASLKTAALDHYQNTAKFPTDFKELGFSPGEYEDGNLIAHISFTAEGGILLNLGDSFDPGAKLLLQSDALQNNAIFRWRCLTNIPQHYLGAVSAAPCQFSETL